ncbi:hypothetical protein Avbf_07332 [Armadillidium vulgare]|nr:hypothetical protein Avbf_07332 [Armadillidium vulgare]
MQKIVGNPFKTDIFLLEKKFVKNLRPFFCKTLRYWREKIMPRHYEKKEGRRRIMYRQDYIARAMIDVQDVDPCRCRCRCSRCRCRLM